MTIKKVIIPEFKIYNLTSIDPKKRGSQLNRVKLLGDSYFIGLHDDYEISVYCHFPLLILPTGQIWDHQLHYFLKKINSIELPHASTLNSIAKSLISFWKFCSEHQIDYLFCTRKSNSPVRRYRRHLSDKIMNSELAVSTAKSHISNVISFYRYLIDYENVSFDYPPWNDRELLVLISSNTGGGFIKKVKSTDVSQAIKGGVSTVSKREYSGYEGRIIDSGDLRPLDMNEQLILLQALKQLKNPEMTLIFVIALCTGARLQTILTLRYRCFQDEYDQEAIEVPVYVGRFNRNGNGFVDTKNDKSLTIYFPIELYTKIKIYLASERASKRQNKYPFECHNDDLQYAFLSQQGNPIYVSKADTNLKYYKSPPCGQAVTTFISERLKPALKALGYASTFKFHDLRATYGMNIVNNALPLINKKENIGQSIDQLFRFLRIRMGHTSLSTTQQYLDFNQNKTIAKDAQLSWESHLKSILGAVYD